MREFLAIENDPRFTWDQPFQRYCLDAIERFNAEDGARQLVKLPIRHGKSELFTVRDAARQIVENPASRILIVANVDRLAQDFSRKVHTLLRRVRPDLVPPVAAVAFWHTSRGGFVRAAGAGATIEGQGYTHIYADDLIERRDQAESAYQRDKLWTWFTDDLWGRREPGCRVRLTMSVWHQDDVMHRLENGGTGDVWDVVCLPALAEENDPLGREIGEPLWPARFDREALEKVRLANPYQFASRYQQRPQPREGGLFKVAMLKTVMAAPPGLPACRAWDLAATEGGGDATAGIKMSGPDAEGTFYVEPLAIRHEPGLRNRIIRQTAESDGAAVRIRIPEDAGAAGKESAASLVRQLIVFSVETVRPTGSKLIRAEPFAAQVNVGAVAVVTGLTPESQRAAYAFIDELGHFPTGAHDDQVDAASDAFAALALPRVSVAPQSRPRASFNRYKPI